MWLLHSPKRSLSYDTTWWGWVGLPRLPIIEDTSKKSPTNLYLNTFQNSMNYLKYVVKIRMDIYFSKGPEWAFSLLEITTQIPLNSIGFKLSDVTTCQTKHAFNSSHVTLKMLFVGTAKYFSSALLKAYRCYEIFFHRFQNLVFSY